MHFTPDNITTLKPNEIFVFGSNERGQHGGGAAKMAMKWGAKWGIGEGLQGQTYALPTKRDFAHTLNIAAIEAYVRTLEEVVAHRPDLHFLITKVGCGLAGLTIEEVAPLFANFIDLPNCSLPREFYQTIKNETN